LLWVDVDPVRGQIQVSGPELESALDPSESVYLQVVLGFEKAGPDLLIARTPGAVALVLVPLLRALHRKQVSVELSDSARLLIQDHMKFLKAFDRAREIGKDPTALRKSLSLPPDFKRPLKGYQKLGTAHLAGIPFAANFSVPGSGKTTMVLAAYALLRAQGQVQKLMVVGPRAAFEPWEDEYEACFGRRPAIGRITGIPEYRHEIFGGASRYEVFLSTYQMFANELENFRHLLGRYRFLMVVDESHHIKKGPGGMWYDALLNAAPLAARRIILSGTPAPNNISDLRAQLEFLWPSLPQLASIFDSIGDLSANMPQVRNGIKGLYTRIKEAELDLPQKIARRIRVEMGPAQARIYRTLAAEVLRRLNLSVTETAMLRDLRRALLIRLIQAATNPSLLAEPAPEFKLPPLSHVDVSLDSLILDYSQYEVPTKFLKAVQVSRELTSKGKKVLVWTTFVSSAYSVAKLLETAEVPTFVVTGLLPRDEADADEQEMTRAETLREFKQAREPCALVATVQSVGESVSLHTACTNAIYLERTFNCGIYMQSMDRIHRIGLPKLSPVHYYLLTARDTIDEVIDRRLEAKMAVMYRLLNDDIGILTYDVPGDDPLNEASVEDVLAVRDSLAKSQPRRKPAP